MLARKSAVAPVGDRSSRPGRAARPPRSSRGERRRAAARSARAAVRQRDRQGVGAGPGSSAARPARPGRRRRRHAAAPLAGRGRRGGPRRRTAGGAIRARRWPHLGGVDVEFLAPDQPRRDALLDDRLEEAAEDRQPVALADAGEAGVVGQRLGQVVAEVPAQAEAVGDHPQQLALGAQPLEEQHELQLEEDDRVDGGPADVGVGPAHQVADEARGRACAPGAGRSGPRGTRSSSDTGGSGPKARSLLPIMAGRSCRHAGSAEGAASSHRAGPFSTGWAVFETGPDRNSDGD